MDVSALDLAAVCAELVGTAGTSAVMINRLLRCYSDAPNELRQLQAQATSAKQALDQILSFLDSDPPAFPRQDDLVALNIYFSAIRTVVNDAQRHVSRLENGATGQPGGTWDAVSSLWDSAEISASEARLIKQVKALSVYIGMAKLDEKSQYLTKRRHAQDLTSARDDAYTYVDAGVTTSFDAPPPYEFTIPPEAGSTPEDTNNVSTSAQPTTASNPQHNSAGPAGRSSETSARPQLRGNIIGYAQRPVSEPNNMDEPSESWLALIRSPPPQATANNAVGPYLGSRSQNNGVGPSESTPALPTPPSRTDTGETSEELQRDGPGTRTKTKSSMSARKKKSMALLQKAKETPFLVNGVQGDALYPEEFRARVGGYTTGITPAWRPVTLAGKGKDKPRYRNRFTKDPGDDMVKSNFKIGDKKMWEAILHKESEKVAEIMQRKWSDNIVVEKQDGLMALHMAASLGLCSTVHALVTTGANPNCTDRFSVTPLHYAADFGCASCIRILVGAGAKVNGVPPKTNVKPPIWYAAERGHAEAAKTLLSLGAHFLNQITAIKETLLHVTVKTGSVPICRALLEAGANPNESFNTLLMASSRSPDLLGCLRKAGADINMRDTNQETLLHKFVAFGDVPMVCYLLALGADPNLADAAGRTPLHTALLHGDLEAAADLARILIKKGADMNAQNARGQTPLHLAVLGGRADAVHVLCQAGADHNICSSADGADKDTDTGTGTSPWDEAQKPDYTTRTAFRLNSSSLADFRKSKHIMGQWHGRPVRRKPTLTTETTAPDALPGGGGGPATPPLPLPPLALRPSTGRAEPAAGTDRATAPESSAMASREMEAHDSRAFAVELPA